MEYHLARVNDLTILIFVTLIRVENFNQILKFFLWNSGWKITLLESMVKRCSFLEHVVDVTGLSNAQVVCDRAEVILFLRCTIKIVFRCITCSC